MNPYLGYEKWTFPFDRIKAGNVYMATSLLSSSLEVDSLTADVEHDDPAILDFTRNGKLLYYAKQGQPVVFRVQNIERIGPRLYRITATSTLGLLMEGQHYGGIYTGQTVETVVGDICGAVPYTVKSSLKNHQLYGWLPIAAPRDNLAQVLFAIGAVLRTTPEGVLSIETLSGELAGTIGADDMYQDSTVKYDAQITAVVLSEHQYIKAQEEERSLFEGDTVDGSVVTFSEPMHSLRAEGLSIRASGANWARLSGGSGKLFGVPYIHNTREVTKSIYSGTTPNVKTVKDATLVSLVNSEAVANRLASFYRWRETINAPVVHRGEMPGDRLTMFHPFDRVAVTACLQSVDISLSGTLKAQETSLVGFVPEQEEDFGYFDTRETITADGTWTVPEGVTFIRVVLIGGGQGGYSGGNGYNGQASDAGGAGGDGGMAGPGASGGKVYHFTMTVTPGQTFAVKIGKGGAGAPIWDVISRPGSMGGNTTFGDKSSDSGSASILGYTDIITGQLFAAKGKDGVAGGKGGKGASSAGSKAEKGGDVGNYVGGAAGLSSSDKQFWGIAYGSARFQFKSFAGGGGGSGAVVGLNGAAGGEGLMYSYRIGLGPPDELVMESPLGGAGANGRSAPASTSKSTMPGGGGDGGNGGAGAGGGGTASGAYGTGGKNLPGPGGIGGKGSAGGDGGDGIVIIYYDSGEDVE